MAFCQLYHIQLVGYEVHVRYALHMNVVDQRCGAPRLALLSDVGATVASVNDQRTSAERCTHSTQVSTLTAIRSN
jgi:hypothetical protein